MDVGQAGPGQESCMFGCKWSKVFPKAFTCTRSSVTIALVGAASHSIGDI